MSRETSDFLRMVAPVSAETWFTIHRRHFIAGRDDPIFPGNALKTVRDAEKDIAYWRTHAEECIYISQGMYRETGGPGFRFPKAKRTKDNLVCAKNLYMDVDVKEDGYATTEEMAAAVNEFIAWASLPYPTVIVSSGSGGWHLYWTMSEAFDLDEFYDMAARLIAAATQFGLKFDRQCTSDATRLLRVPGTWNYKYYDAEKGIEPTHVRLDRCDRQHIDRKDMQLALSPWPANLTLLGKPKAMVDEVDDNGVPLSENDDLSGGMKRDFAPSDIDAVAQDCAFIRDTLATGGAGYSETLWKYSLAIASRCIEPEATAHRLSEGYNGYDPAATEQKLAQPHGSGPPSCRTIGQDAPQCAACPHNNLGSNPLGIGHKLRPRNTNVPHAAAAFTTAKQPTIAFDNYYQDRLSLCMYKTEPDTGDGQKATMVFEYPIIAGSASLEAGSPFKFVITVIQGEQEVIKKFDSSFCSDNAKFAAAMAATGLPITIKVEQSRLFMSHYIKLLQSDYGTLVTIPAFGWSPDKKGDMGFAFAGEFVSPAGMVRCSEPPEALSNYAVRGSEQTWIDFAAIVVTSDRPDLSCMIASSFGAPLVGMTGESGLLMGVISGSSGIGKSTALILGQSVWSSPRVGGLDDTVVYTFSKCAALRHLPMFYDEIKGEPQIKNMTRIAFQLTGGREKGRGDRSGKMRPVQEFQTLCGYAANGSIVDGVRQEDKGTDASWLRIFEMEGIQLSKASPNFSAKVSNLRIALATNYGGIGRRYATYLGQNHAKIQAFLDAYKLKVGQQLGADMQVDRFWIAAITTTLVGAALANNLGVVKFDIHSMQAYMFAEFRRMKSAMEADPSDYSSPAGLLTTIGSFLNEKHSRNMVIQDKTWTRKGRPPAGYAKILNDKPDNGWGKLEVQVSGDPLTVRISDMALTDWCIKTKHQKHMITTHIKGTLNGAISSVVIGSGSSRGGAKENVWSIPAPVGSDLAEWLEYNLNYKLLP